MLTTLRRIVLAFGQEPELDLALQTLVSEVKLAMETECCSIYLANQERQHFLLMASDGLAKESLGQVKIGFSEGLVGLVGQREEPINIADAHNHPRFKHAPEVKEEAFNAFLGTPIIHQRRVLGIISVQQKQSRQFTENEEAFLVTLAAQLASTISNVESRGTISALLKRIDKTHMRAIPGASGVAIGNCFVSRPLADLSSITPSKQGSPAQQTRRLRLAIARTSKELIEMRARMDGSIPKDTLDIFDMYQQMLSSASIGDDIEKYIVGGWSAESALKLVIDRYVMQFEAVEDNYIRERAVDIKDLGNRVLLHLQDYQQKHIRLPDDLILVAQEVTASLLAEYQHKGLKGIISLSGSINSHAVILARALGIPAIMGVGDVPLSRFADKQAIIDGYSGEIFLAPTPAKIKHYQRLIEEESELQENVRKDIELEPVTLDGQSVELLMNAGLIAEFDRSMKHGASGIGLYRTEIAFMERGSFPSEKEQMAIYKNVLNSFKQQPVVMRTLDIGGDKTLEYFPINEANPFLGWRGIRVTLDHPELFLVQVRAMVRANIGRDNLQILLPMITSLPEVDEALRLIHQAYSEIRQEHGEAVKRPPVGIMLEVPSLIFQIPELAHRVDFFSVGSNDLTQYLLAVDRNNERVSSLYDAYHPAVLRALNIIAEQSKAHKVSLSLCGELASEPGGAILLLAMGYDKLSMNGYNVPRIKWVIRHISQKHARQMLETCLQLDTVTEVRGYLNQQLEQLGFGGFIRAGK
ncbi:phosphoenolpyruvate--protein phosphotransferase [Thalassotalea mangrovi]|uniref:phosphoenolpyruvate--protein phosphotransferase n=1 Tax=Thalassotalea mangrovi TaxID=2572245 RepID=A0A4U1B3F0_9GAMM|nr:phosphoenolpyruvate--protein phosphotransferase [Thalassotalea mangrovi]TKB44239.1 phosphoenolpyruvate--protein phosphotransferase [Thalassotalea mangrovi]